MQSTILRESRGNSLIAPSPSERERAEIKATSSRSPRSLSARKRFSSRAHDARASACVMSARATRCDKVTAELERGKVGELPSHLRKFSTCRVIITEPNKEEALKKSVFQVAKEKRDYTKMSEKEKDIQKELELLKKKEKEREKEMEKELQRLKAKQAHREKEMQKEVERLRKKEMQIEHEKQKEIEEKKMKAKKEEEEKQKKREAERRKEEEKKKEREKQKELEKQKKLERQKEKEKQKELERKEKEKKELEKKKEREKKELEKRAKDSKEKQQPASKLKDKDSFSISIKTVEKTKAEKKK